MNKIEYELQMKIMELNQYDPTLLVKQENSQMLFNVISEAKKYKENQIKLAKELEIKEKIRELAESGINFSSLKTIGHFQQILSLIESSDIDGSKK